MQNFFYPRGAPRKAVNSEIKASNVATTLIEKTNQKLGTKLGTGTWRLRNLRKETNQDQELEYFQEHERRKHSTTQQAGED